MLNIDQAIAVICKEFEGFAFISYQKEEQDASRCVVRGTYKGRNVALTFPIFRLRKIDETLLANIRKSLIGNTET
jgi:hypothetical protein